MNWQIHPFLGGGIGRGFEEGLERGGGQINFQYSFKAVEKVGDPKGARQPFLGKLKRSLQENAIGSYRHPKKGIPPLKRPKFLSLLPN
jgi:hypothetical protein